MRAIWGEVDGRRLMKAGGAIGEGGITEKGKRIGGADEERFGKRDGGVKVAMGGHC